MSQENEFDCCKAFSDDKEIVLNVGFIGHDIPLLGNVSERMIRHGK
jgi:hypothetical protein